MRREFTLTLVALALLALTACSVETEVTPPNPSQGDEISFGSVSTRVDSASEINEFSVWATVSSIGSNAVSYQPLLTNERVYRNPAGSNKWVYDNVENWISNSIFHFFAAYPYNIGVEQHSAIQNGLNYSVYTLEVTADGSANTEDILVATSVVNTNDQSFNSNNPVDLSFGHLLSRVNVKIRQNFDVDPDFNYYVTKITISGIKGKGSYMTMPYNNSWYTYWDFEDAPNIILEKDFSDNPVLLRNEGAADPIVILTVWDDGLMLIPQEFAGGNIAVRVDYLYDVDLNDDDMGEAKFVEGFVPAGKWESGKSINYTLSIANSSFITFEQPTIDPWGAPQTGGTIIIQ